MSLATDARARLTAEQAFTTPNCDGDDRFIADSLPAATQADLKALCDDCPLVELCREYAELERPKAGYWAGKTYRNYKTKGDN